MDNATWCPTPAAASAARRLRPAVSKNSSTALSSNEGEFSRSITTCAPARASLSPSPVMVLTPLSGEAATTSWPRWRRMATVFMVALPCRRLETLKTILAVNPDAVASQIDDDITGRLRTADEKVAISRLVEWLRFVDDCPGDQTALRHAQRTG